MRFQTSLLRRSDLYQSRIADAKKLRHGNTCASAYRAPTRPSNPPRYGPGNKASIYDPILYVPYIFTHFHHPHCLFASIKANLPFLRASDILACNLRVAQSAGRVNVSTLNAKVTSPHTILTRAYISSDPSLTSLLTSDMPAIQRITFPVSDAFSSDPSHFKSATDIVKTSAGYISYAWQLKYASSFSLLCPTGRFTGSKSKTKKQATSSLVPLVPSHIRP